MTTLNEIHEITSFWKPLPGIIEKDYVLWWMIWGISHHPALSQKWVFKGRTCIKKCIANTYRYSEDLDFTNLKDVLYKLEELFPIFSELLPEISTESGIKFISQKPQFEFQLNGVFTEGCIYFIGPGQTRTPIRIKMDITNDELVASPPVLRPIDHPYSDELISSTIRAYKCLEKPVVILSGIPMMGTNTISRLLHMGTFCSSSSLIVYYNQEADN